MGSMTVREDLVGFLGNGENARNLNGLVEDIRYALIDYQVRAPKRATLPYLTSAPDLVTTRHLR